MQIFIQTLQEKIATWRENGYEGVYPETKNILRQIHSVRFLRAPQKEAFDTYVYLKEIANNASIRDVIAEFAGTNETLLQGLGVPKAVADVFSELRPEAQQKQIAENSEKYGFIYYGYANYVFALTMGSGKTILMATLLMYEFVIAYKHDDDERFAKNALVFGPADTSIVGVLKEIKDFLTNSHEKILPDEYMDLLLNIRYWYLEKPETPLKPIGNFNVIVSNSSKIILKNWKDSHIGNKLFELRKSESNKRLDAIQGLESLTIFVDEAHHSYGEDIRKKLNQARKTIQYLSENTKVASVINMTGTPYVKNVMLPDTVYTYGLKDGIEHGILKKVYITDHGSRSDLQSNQFVDTVVSEFWFNYGENRIEGRLPKIAFYTTDIEMLEQLEGNLDKALLRLKIPLTKKISWHSKYTGQRKKDADFEFDRLDTVDSEKQFILLVNKGTEGWNCKSLVAVALYKNSTSNNFVLQASCRCLRQIGDNSTIARVFLSDENYKVLDKELEKSFDTNIAGLNNQNQDSVDVDLVVEKRQTVKVKKLVSEIKSHSKIEPKNIHIDLKKVPIGTSVRVMERQEIVLNEKKDQAVRNKVSVSYPFDHLQDRVRTFGFYDIVALIQEKTHFSYTDIRILLNANKINKKKLIQTVKKGPLAIDVIANQILEQAFDYKKVEFQIEQELELTKAYPFKITVKKNSGETDKQAFERSLVVYKNEHQARLGFHIDPYNFDSRDELELFSYLMKTLDEDERVKDVYFTGGVTNEKHNEFFFEYQNNLPEGSRISKYFPDFLIETSKGRYLVIEVKGDDKELTYNSEKKRFDEGSITKDEITSDPLMKEIGFNEFQEMNQNFEYHIIFNAAIIDRKQRLIETINML